MTIGLARPRRGPEPGRSRQACRDSLQSPLMGPADIVSELPMAIFACPERAHRAYTIAD